jgi:transposase
MRRLETLEFWPELVTLKDELSLRELSERFGVTPGAISAALKRTGTTRTAAPPGPRAARKRAGELPPEAGATDGDAPPRPRPGSKDHLIHAHWDILGNVPDAEVAREAGVSVRTVASFRARHNVPGYTGPRRSARSQKRRPSKIDAFAHLLGTVPDRVVAQQAGVSLNAVRNYRNKRGISAAPRERGAEASAPVSAGGSHAWRVTLRQGGAEVVRVVVAADIGEALSLARTADAEVIGLNWVGALLD